MFRFLFVMLVCLLFILCLLKKFLCLFSLRQSAARPMNLVTIYDIQNKFVGVFVITVILLL